MVNQQGRFHLSKRLPSVMGILLCCGIVLWIIHSVQAQTGGLLVYPLDDSYIHLAVARTLAQTGVWGVNPWHFASASSSPGWTLMLAVVARLFGSHLMTPIVLNLMFVVGVMFTVDYGFDRLAPKGPLWY